MKVSLLNFLVSGKFGEIDLGASKNNVLHAFGEPEAKSLGSRRHPEPLIWKYEDIEFHFAPSDGALWLIHIDRFSHEAYPMAWGDLQLDPWIIREGMSQEALFSSLADIDNVEIANTQQKQFEDVLTLNSGVELGFTRAASPYGPPVGLGWISKWCHF